MHRSHLLIILPLIAIGFAAWGAGCQNTIPTGLPDNGSSDGSQPAGNGNSTPPDNNVPPPGPASFVFSKPSVEARVVGSGNVQIEWTAGDPTHDATLVVEAIAQNGKVTLIGNQNVSAGVQAGQIVWNVQGLPAGTYRLRGSVFTGSVLVARSFAAASVVIEVTAPNSPTIRITSPSSGDRITRGRLANIRWDDGDVSGATVELKLQQSGKSKVLLHGRPASLSGDDNSMTWDTTPYPAGAYQVSGTLRDGNGTVLASTPLPYDLQVVANQPPRFRWVWPAAPVSINKGTPLILTWETSDAEDPVDVSIDAVRLDNSNSLPLVNRTEAQSDSFLRDSQSVTTSQFPDGDTTGGDYRLRATVNDGVNPAVSLNAPFVVSILPGPIVSPGPGANQAPTLAVDEPSLNRTYGRGISHLVTVRWRATDDNCPSPASCASAARLTLYADPDPSPNVNNSPSGNEFVIARNIVLNTGVSQFTFNTLVLPEGVFTIYGILDDGANTPVFDDAPGHLTIVASTGDVDNQPPVVNVCSPNGTNGLFDGQTLLIQFGLEDPDFLDRFEVAITLDKDRISNNDNIVPGDPVRSTAIELARVRLPAATRGACGALPIQLLIPVNEDTIPPISESNALGEPIPYNIRLDVDDGFRDPITSAGHVTSAYARGGLFVLGRLSTEPTGVVDMRQIGRTVGGAIFNGFAEGDAAGSGVVRVPHIVGETFPARASNIDDLMILARDRGTAFLIMGGFSGISDQGLETGRYAGSISLNSVAFGGPGGVFGSTYGSGGGTLSSAAAMMPPSPAVDGPGRAMLLGFQNVAGLGDLIDDDPLDICDCDSANNSGPPDSEPVYDETRYCDGPSLAGPATTDCPASIGLGDGLPNSRSDTQDSQEFFSVGPVCERGRDNDDLSSPNAINNAFRSKNSGVLASRDPDYETAIMSMVYYAPFQGLVISTDGQIGQNGIRLDILGQGITTNDVVGARLRGAWFDSRNAGYPFTSDQYVFAADFNYENDATTQFQNSEFGATITALNPDAASSSVLVSAPGVDGSTGEIWIFNDEDFFIQADDQGIRSLPIYGPLPSLSRSGRSLGRINDVTRPISRIGIIKGVNPGDRFGNPAPAGDINKDGIFDFTAGAPGLDQSIAVTDSGACYVIYRTPFNETGVGSRRIDTVPGFSIIGTHANDHVGNAQGLAGDFNGDSIADLILGAGDFGAIGSKTGAAAVVFGSPTLTGTFSIDELGVAAADGTSLIPSYKFVGKNNGDEAGAAVAGIGDYDGDGFSDILITAPGQTWPAANIEFLAVPADGDRVIINVSGNIRTYEFDTNSSTLPGNVPVTLETSGIQPITAESHLREAMQIDGRNQRQAGTGLKYILSGRVLNVATGLFSTNVISSSPDPAAFSVTLAGAGVNARLRINSNVARRGITYLIFASNHLKNADTVVLPDDVVKSNPNRKLRSLIFLGPTPTLPGSTTFTVQNVAGIGDFDGDGFADFGLGLPDADVPFESDPTRLRLGAGQCYVIYGEQPQQ